MNCPFCIEIKNNSDNPFKKNRIIKETPHFIVIPTLGGFVNNYLLIIPKRHINCFGELNFKEVKEFNILINWLKDINKQFFQSNTILFEHGSLNNLNNSGKSIIHAHIHILPFNKSLLNDINEKFQIQTIKSIESLQTICHNMNDYLYFQDIDGESYVISHIGVPSQFLRKIFANSLNLDTWNWREFPYLENIEENIKFYQKIKSKEYF